MDTILGEVPKLRLNGIRPVKIKQWCLAICKGLIKTTTCVRLITPEKVQVTIVSNQKVQQDFFKKQTNKQCFETKVDSNGCPLVLLCLVVYCPGIHFRNISSLTY